MAENVNWQVFKLATYGYKDSPVVIIQIPNSSISTHSGLIQKLHFREDTFQFSFAL